MYRQKNKTPYNMAGQMKVGLIGESGFCVNAEQMRRSDVIDHRMHRVGNKSLRFPERIESGKVFEHFVNHTCI